MPPTTLPLTEPRLRARDGAFSLSPLAIPPRSCVFRAFTCATGDIVPRWNGSPQEGRPVPRFFFDTLDGDRFIPDEPGVELPSVEAARAEAGRSLADLAPDLPSDDRRQVVVEVKDEAGRPSSGLCC